MVKQGTAEETSMGRNIEDAARTAGEEAFASIYGDTRGDEKPDEPKDDESEETTSDDAAANVETGDGDEESETEEEASSEGTDPIETYLGVDLSGLPADERATLVEAFNTQNQLISQLQRERASDEEAGSEGADAEPTTYTDEDLYAALGIDPEMSTDPERDKRELSLARALLTLQEQVESLSTGSEAAAEEKFWESSLDKLESEYGPLPVKAGETQADTRLRLYEMAASGGIGDPEAAYWRFMGPARAQLQKEVEQKLAAARKAGKKSATTPRPKANTGSEDEMPKYKDVKSAFKDQALKAAEKLGFDWEDARKARVNVK